MVLVNDIVRTLKDFDISNLTEEDRNKENYNEDDVIEFIVNNVEIYIFFNKKMV